MRRVHSLTLGFAFGLVVLSGLAFAQTATPSLREDVPQLFPSGSTTSSSGTLVTTAPAAGDCGGQLTVNTATNTSTFATANPPNPTTNGSFWLADTSVNLNLVFDGAGPAAYANVDGFSVTATLSARGTILATGSGSVPDQTTTTLEVSLARSANVTSAPLNSTLLLTIVLTDTGASAGAPVFGRSVQIQCGSTTSLEGFAIVNGQPVDGDFDVDGSPDSEDQDIDGDNVPNAEEFSGQCLINDNQVNFQQAPAVTPGDHDNDGYSDERECEAGSDPLDAVAIPPQPAPFPWPLVIMLFLLVVLIAAVVFFFTVYGKAATIALVTAGELVVPPGTSGKYQLVVQNLRKKGNPINFQLSAQGMPDGWDARLQPDHAVLDPVGGAKNSETVWLQVEAPQHTDPESAVVKVKAIALNAAGKKDTLKLPASVATITSINVPPNAKVPIKRGEPVKIKSEKELAKEAAAAAAPGGESMPVAAAEAPPEEPAPKAKKGKKGAAPAPAPPPTPASTPGAKPALQVGGLAHSPATFTAGQDVKSMVTVTNNGADHQTLKLSLFVNDALADAQTVSVKPGKSKEVKFKWTAQERNKLNIRGELVAG